MYPDLRSTLARINARQEATSAMVIAGAAELAALALFIGMVAVWAAVWSGQL